MLCRVAASGAARVARVASSPRRRLCSSAGSSPGGGAGADNGTAWEAFWMWTTQARPSWKSSPTEAAVAFTVFGVTGSSSVALVRPAIKSTRACEDGRIVQKTSLAEVWCRDARFPSGRRHHAQTAPFACHLALGGTSQHKPQLSRSLHHVRTRNDPSGSRL